MRSHRKRIRVPVLCIDFDGVIFQRTGRFVAPHILEGYPMPGAREAIDLLSNNYEVIVHSCRCATEQGAAAIEQWLRNNEFNVSSVARFKPYADAYIDDKGVRHESWFDTLRTISEPLSAEFQAMQARVLPQ